jgi:soluble lytic murein transglycosylase-like protein
VNVQPHVSLSLLMAVGWVESRFSPTGSAADRRSRHYGVMQIFCDHDCNSYLDPATNIRRGASLLALRRQQVFSVRQRPRVLAAWQGAYWWGSVPATRRRGVVRKWYRYAARVQATDRMMRDRMNQCRRNMPGE